MNKIDHVISYTQDTCSALMNGFVLKCLGAISILLVQFSFDSVGFKIITAVVLLIIIDTITGVVGAYRAGEVISSKRFFDSVIKLLFFPMMIATGSIAQTAIGVYVLALPQLIAGYLAIHEFLSVIENFGKIGYHIPNKIINKKNLESLINKK